MKEQETDDLERMFREGLRDLQAEPDAAVWVAIQDAMKKRRRFWLFWSITSMVAIGLVATLLLQNQTMDHSPLTIVQQGEEGLETKDPQSQNPEPLPAEKPAKVGGTQNPINHPDRVRRSFSAKEQQADGTSVEEEPSRRIEEQGVSRHGSLRQAQDKLPLTMTEDPAPETQNPKPQERHPEQAEGTSVEEETPRRVEGPVPNSLMSLRIPFLYQEQLRDYPLLASTYQPKPTGDSIKKVSPWSMAFNPGLLLPSIQTYGKTGTVNYEKINESNPGISMALWLNYRFKDKWTLRTGMDWSSYSVSGTHRYFGYTDTVEWIDRKHNTGFQVIEKSRSWQFESQYQWIGIPIELGRRQNLGAGFSWDWTLGAGFNYLYRYEKIAEGNKYLAGIDEGIKRTQLSLLAGFSVNYQLGGPWSSFINVNYRLQPNRLYDSELLREKHQILRFGIGLQYQFNWKGN